MTAITSRTMFKSLKLKQEARRARKAENVAYNAAQKALAGKRKLPSVPRLEKELKVKQDIWIRRRDGPFCLTCSVAYPMRAAFPGYARCHIVPAQEGLAATWNLDGQYWGCAACNAAEHYHRAHWAREIFPKVFLDGRITGAWVEARRTINNKRIFLMEKLAEVDALLATKPGPDQER